MIIFHIHLRVQGQMAQRINVALNSIPSGCRDLAEFAFFCGVGFTFGSLGLIWLKSIDQYRWKNKKFFSKFCIYTNVIFIAFFLNEEALMFSLPLRWSYLAESPTKAEPRFTHICS